jgi:hypothetical protein
MRLTIQFPEAVAQEVLQLPDRDSFISHVVSRALKERADTLPAPVSGRSKWAALVSRVENDPDQLGPRDYTKLRNDMREFREDFHFQRGESG